MLMESEQPPYDFIMNSGASPQKQGILPSGASKKQRILIMAGIGAVLLIIFGMIFSLLFGGENPNTAASLKMAQQHTEALRIADIGTKKARGSEARNLAATAKLSLQSTEDKIVAIASKERKLKPAELAGAKSTKTDDLLTRAEQNNLFDEAFIETLRGQIRTYLAQIRVVHQGSSSKNDKKTLDEVHAQLSQILPAESE